VTRALFVGDGDRDAQTVPAIVQAILGRPVSFNTRPWKSIRAGGYERKVQFALRLVSDGDSNALVATVDADRARPRERLGKLRAGRSAHREKQPPIPCALGEARPHGEAWLLDDPIAVCDALDIPRESDIPTVRQAKDCKKALHELIQNSRAADKVELDVLAGIAEQLSPDRCQHAGETGFRDFVEDVRSELGDLP